MRKVKYIIGIDEVGRGPLAGPIVVAALALPLNLKIKYLRQEWIRPRREKAKIPRPAEQSPPKGNRLPTGQALRDRQFKNKKLFLRDSKKLSPHQRGIWFQHIKEELVLPHAVASVSPNTIDKINVANAANLAATRALAKVHKFISYKFSSLNNKRVRVFLDGGLFIEKTKLINLKTYKLKTIVRGDEKIPAIMLASIVAKVSRDRKMKKLHNQHPHYDFINNVGYGTKKHRRAIRKYGPAKIHRLTFIKRYVKLAKVRIFD